MRPRIFVLCLIAIGLTTRGGYAQESSPPAAQFSLPSIQPPEENPPAGLLQQQWQTQQQEINSLNQNVTSLKEQVNLSQPSPADPSPETSNRDSVAPDSLPLDQLQAALVALGKKEEAQPGQKMTPEQMQKQLELQKQQIDVLNKMVKLLAKQVGQQGPSVDKLQTDVATLDSRSKQAAQRDKDLQNGLDNIIEHQDALERFGPQLPAGLRELFVPSGTNETQLSIYGALAVGYSHILGDSLKSAVGATGPRPSTPGGFYFGEFTPDFLLKLNDWIFLEAEIGIGSDGSVGAGSFAQADFFINDWLTIIAGRFVAPIGWFNERLNNPWINKLPGDAPGSGPLLWQQVLPPLALLGVMAQGSFYICDSPLKFEYAAYVSNGLNLAPGTPGAPTIDELADLEGLTNTFSFVTNEKAFGGRLGLWWPEQGLAGGISAMTNGDFVAGGFEESINLWAVDLNYHKGNWDVRAEYGNMFEQAGSFIGRNIRRQGFYAQVAYRPWDLPPGILQQLEFVYRYSYIDIRGIDATTLDLSAYGTPVDVPIRRQQNEFGIDYWIYPRMVIKVAYQINDEPGFHLHDNQFITELAWGW
jgi:hypothetical protein